MEIELLDLIELAVAYAKDLETKQCFEKLKKAELDLMKQDALSRREKSAALIKFISAVDIQIRKLNYMFTKYSFRYSEEEQRVYASVLKKFEAQREQAVAEKSRFS